MASYRSLLAERATLDRKIAQARRREIAAVVKQINSLIAQYGLSPDELQFPAEGASGQGGRSGTKRRASASRPGKSAKSAAVKSGKQPLPPKYRDPETGKTWSGRGRVPSWLVGDREQYAI